MARRSLVVVVALMLAALGVVAPGASAAANPGEETEAVELELRPHKDVLVRVEIHPLLGIAVINTWVGLSPRGEPRTRNGAVSYAARIPKGPAEGMLDVTIPGIASIVGDLVSTSPETSSHSECPQGERNEDVEFRGDFYFHGNDSYLGFDAHRAEGFVQRTSSKYCEAGRPEILRRHPDLFSYLRSELTFSTGDGEVLDSEVSLPGRHTSFLAKRSVDGTLSNFAVETYEWLPGRVAARRRTEVAKAAGHDFVVDEPKVKYPESATIHLPEPFSGSGVFRRGAANARGRGLLDGPLYADVEGVKVRLDAREGKAFLINPFLSLSH
jgi:hypothetical protein